MNSALSLPARTALAGSAMRTDACLLIATLCLWIVTFLLLGPLLGGGGPPATPHTAAEAVQQIEAHRAGQLIVLALGTLAMLIGIIPLIRIGRRLRSSPVAPLATVGLTAAVLALALLVFHSYLVAGLSFAYPPDYPPLVDRVELYATKWMATTAYILWTFSVALVGASLARLGILTRTGWSVATLGVILGVLMIVVRLGVPIIPAPLSVALGISLLRRKG